ncbi:hypothetical protein GUJ93_ZPchr0010g9449 [Zizania palustris]|uniref:Pectinesterase inhibitor domain-containing protein n=1 Tax=Zizania palustris TaxID=103762 RepID=A0A8J5WB85_ZIZPA|nr:hypothetical protein GUJ93_ZPchr0010g9449 [Zizania palustris]
MATVLLLLVLLPTTTLCSRAGSPSHHSHGHAKHSPPPAPQAAALVRSTCNSTAYYDVCVSALAADPSSTTADVRGLSAIAVSVAAANASVAAQAAAALANATGTAQAPLADGAVQALLRTCAAKYGNARDALAAAKDSIAQQDYDYASVHVSAAAEYPQVCKTLFRRQRPGAYPAELAAREEALKQLCSVALDIIALLSSSNS